MPRGPSNRCPVGHRIYPVYAWNPEAKNYRQVAFRFFCWTCEKVFVVSVVSREVVTGYSGGP